jgi:hypothetical protein
MWCVRGLKLCLHPPLAVLAEVRLMAQLWLRSGNISCDGNLTAFFLDLWENLPGHIRLGALRADSCFCPPELLALWQQLRLPYVVVAHFEPADSKTHQRQSAVEGDRSAGHRSGRVGIPIA